METECNRSREPENGGNELRVDKHGVGTKSGKMLANMCRLAENVVTRC
jgi:hypothetical protein